MRYVLDSCTGFKWLVVEQDTDKARQLRDDYRQAIHELIAPDVFPIEVSHALTRAERQGRITTAQGAQLMADMLNTLPQLFPSLPLLPRAYQISSAARIGVYDCLYVALAEQEGCELVTTDMRLITNLGSQFSFIVPLSSLAGPPPPPSGPTPPTP
jgi:predicted nucleic acid-binding protein